ncbi:hypothetical protein ACFIQF_08550 [Comamonas sp. J-3]|uniref:hypothetical protein n=1 Tax=Comamonas trifloxystrobinivorans TaxID=3350256 RepID=UPI00372A3029
MAHLALWILRTGCSHLFAGALLQLAEPASANGTWRAGDDVLIEFSDQTQGHGQLSAATGPDWLLRLAARQTARGSSIAAQIWLLQAHSTPHTWRALRPPVTFTPP